MPNRDNGFVARHYLPLADLDPRLAHAMLDVLRAEGIAAYVEPSTGHLGGYLEVHLPERPRDRLWVDKDRHEQAAALLSAHAHDDLGVAEFPSPQAQSAELTERDNASTSPLPPQQGQLSEDPQPVDEDAAWAQLMASFELPAYEPPRRPDHASDGTINAPDVPAVDDVADPNQSMLPFRPTPFDKPASDGTTAADDQQPVRRRVIRPADATSLRPSGAAPVAGDEVPHGEYDPLSVLDEHFVPPSPPPIPTLRPATWAAILAIVVGFGLVISSTFTDVVPDAAPLGVAGMLGGFGSLVYHMRQERPSDDDPDDGAIV